MAKSRRIERLKENSVCTSDLLFIARRHVGCFFSIWKVIDINFQLQSLHHRLNFP